MNKSHIVGCEGKKEQSVRESRLGEDGVPTVPPNPHPICSWLPLLPGRLCGHLNRPKEYPGVEAFFVISYGLTVDWNR